MFETITQLLAPGQDQRFPPSIDFKAAQVRIQGSRTRTRCFQRVTMSSRSNVTVTRPTVVCSRSRPHHDYRIWLGSIAMAVLLCGLIGFEREYHIGDMNDAGMPYEGERINKNANEMRRGEE